MATNPYIYTNPYLQKEYEEDPRVRLARAAAAKQAEGYKGEDPLAYGISTLGNVLGGAFAESRAGKEFAGKEAGMKETLAKGMAEQDVDKQAAIFAENPYLADITKMALQSKIQAAQEARQFGRQAALQRDMQRTALLAPEAIRAGELATQAPGMEQTITAAQKEAAKGTGMFGIEAFGGADKSALAETLSSLQEKRTGIKTDPKLLKGYGLDQLGAMLEAEKQQLPGLQAKAEAWSRAAGGLGVPVMRTPQATTPTTTKKIVRAEEYFR